MSDTETKARAAKAETAEQAFEAEQKAAEKAAAEAEAARIAAAQEEARLNLKKALSDATEDLAASDKASAIDTRLKWVRIGQLLIDGQAAFLTVGKDGAGNTLNDKAYGKWLADQGFSMLGSRPTRAGAIWLARVYNEKPDLYDMFPTVPKGDEPLRRSPRTLQAWVREQVADVFQMAYEADADGVQEPAGSKEAKYNAAIASMPNVYGVLNEAIDAATGLVQVKADAMAKAKGDARLEAVKALAAAEEAQQALLDKQAILNLHTDAERLDLFTRWTPKKPAVAFKDASPEVAAEKLFGLLKTHEEFSAVYEALGRMVAELEKKIEANDGEADAEGDDAEGFTDDGEGEGDFEATEGDEEGFAE
jgi:uncharacterized protein YycO